LGLHLIDIYRSPNIGVFLKANDRFLLVPKGLAPTKADRLSASLGVTAVPASIGESRLLGPLVSMNGKGVLVSRLAEQNEIDELAAATGLNVARLESRFTAVGNLVAANDHGAIVSPVLEPHAVKQVEDVLGTKTLTMAIADYIQVGAMIVATNSGAAMSPSATEQEAEEVAKVLKVEVSASSVNGGIPYPASGVVANTKNAVAGYLTTGPELIFLTRALNV